MSKEVHKGPIQEFTPETDNDTIVRKAHGSVRNARQPRNPGAGGAGTSRTEVIGGLGNALRGRAGRYGAYALGAALVAGGLYESVHAINEHGKHDRQEAQLKKVDHTIDGVIKIKSGTPLYIAPVEAEVNLDDEKSVPEGETWYAYKPGEQSDKDGWIAFTKPVEAGGKDKYDDLRGRASATVYVYEGEIPGYDPSTALPTDVNERGEIVSGNQVLLEAGMALRVPSEALGDQMFQPLNK